MASSCSSEHSCCDDPACELSSSSFVQSSEACSLEACLNPEQCDQVDCCSDEACIHPTGSDTRNPTDSGENDNLSQHQDDFFDFLNYDAFNSNAPLPCQWLETDHQCSVSAPPAALSQHVFKDHIEQNALLSCEWAQCDQTIDSQQLLQHVVQTHQPDKYICLWQGCGSSFSSDDELAAHMSAMHCQDLDCHWAGCGYFHKDAVALKSHVTDEHLSLRSHEAFRSYPYNTYQAASSSAESAHVSHPSSSSSFDTPYSQHSLVHQPPNQPYPRPSTQPGVHSGNSRQHTCLWSTDQSAGSICSASFDCENDLQDHIEHAHLSHLSARTHPLGTAVFVCKWQGCRTSGSSHNGKDKLRKHTYTHTGCQ